MSDQAELEAKAKAYVGEPIGPAEVGADLVNEPMIRHWCEVMGDGNPIYTDAEVAKNSAHGGIVAPPTMMQAWIMEGYAMADTSGPPRDRQRELHQIFDSYGYTGVVATNCEQEYKRYLRPGDRISATTVFESVSGEKKTGLGMGYFIATRTTFVDQRGDEVGSMLFRVLKFKPAQKGAQ